VNGNVSEKKSFVPKGVHVLLREDATVHPDAVLQVVDLALHDPDFSLNGIVSGNFPRDTGGVFGKVLRDTDECFKWVWVGHDEGGSLQAKIWSGIYARIKML